MLGLRKRGISVLFLHHAGKNRSQRGTSKREDLLDTVVTLKHPSDYDHSQGLRCEVHFEKTRAQLGDAAKSFEVTMQGDPTNGAKWTERSLEDANTQKATELFSAGASVRDVAEELGISKSAAGRLRQKCRSDSPTELSHRPTV
jgi:putative DNA primase/helicase